MATVQLYVHVCFSIKGREENMKMHIVKTIRNCVRTQKQLTLSTRSSFTVASQAAAAAAAGAGAAAGAAAAAGGAAAAAGAAEEGRL